jgi:hypothetical protein
MHAAKWLIKYGAKKVILETHAGVMVGLPWGFLQLQGTPPGLQVERQWLH